MHCSQLFVDVYQTFPCFHVQELLYCINSIATRFLAAKYFTNYFRYVEKYFTLKLAKHWYRLLKKAIELPSLAIFNTRQDASLSNLVYLDLL